MTQLPDEDLLAALAATGAPEPLDELIVRYWGECYRIYLTCLNDPEAARDLQGILANVDLLIADARDGRGMVGRILRSEELADEFAGVVHNLDALLAKANDPSAGALGAITSDAEMAADLKATIANLRFVSDQLTQQKGLIGALINDEDLTIRFRRILNQVARAIEDAREAAPISNFVQVLLGTF